MSEVHLHVVQGITETIAGAIGSTNLVHQFGGELGASNWLAILGVAGGCHRVPGGSQLLLSIDLSRCVDGKSWERHRVRASGGAVRRQCSMCTEYFRKPAVRPMFLLMFLAVWACYFWHWSDVFIIWEQPSFVVLRGTSEYSVVLRSTS